MTILPSPDPKSINFPCLPPNALNTFSICTSVAGIYGRQYLLKAGLTNGTHIIVIPTAIPPTKENT